MSVSWKSNLRPLTFLAALLAAGAGQLHNYGMTFAERLGWKAADVVVILHVDDVGMSHPSNRGAIDATESGVATSFATMMPCPWVSEISQYLKAHPTADNGLHLTLTSEWKLYRWGPVAGKAAVPGLVDREGCLWPSVEEVATHASADEVEKELRAQLDRARVIGLPITHLDSHMGTLFARPDYFERFAVIGIEAKIPILVIGGSMAHLEADELAASRQLMPWVKKVWNAGLPVLDDLVTGFTRFPAEEKPARLSALLRDLQPGVTEILFHASEPSPEFPLITGSHAARGADLRTLKDPGVRQTIQERGIILTTWRELMERRQKAQPME